MNKQANILEILGEIREKGTDFDFDEAKLVRESEKRSADKAGLAIKVLSIFGGLLTTLIFLVFLALAGMYDEYDTIFVLGMVFIGVAVALNKIFNLLIIDTSVIAVYIIGFCLLGYGMSWFHYSENEICTAFIAISLVSLIIAQNFVLAFVSVLIINGSFIALILIHEHMGMIHLYNAGNTLLLIVLLLMESKVLRAGKIISRLYNPLRTALIFSLLAGLFFVSKKWWMDPHLDVQHVWLSSVVSFFGALLLVNQVMRVFGRTSQKDLVIAYSASIPVLLSVAFQPAICGSMLIIGMCFRANYKTGFVIGIMAFIYFIAQFYYDLNFTLLTKSLLLFFSGVLFILCFVFTHFKWKSNEKV